ncbi:helix-turn-helix domain-containing protein [Pleionea sp. CnH1-48]|uniref:AraC family transcriptional regulator n=1 Tax=Pleionea sp. CnH1-48 TaxID=2954494 RepID=UPI002096B012|nr:helix-turn-helix domain-containing protein [Pleionea sp. CnH1-48]MCO7226973.1 AraC family transcriptional regulator [Pleionea sp. CnH1-48]
MMSWPQRMNRAIEYIEQHLAGELSIDDVARVAACSRFHFHRVFLASFNVTFAEYVRKRRMTLAATEVTSGDKTILDIAQLYGYDSPNAFTRAFKKLHGMNPSKARSSQARLSAYRRVSFPLELSGEEKMDYRIVERPSFKVVGRSKNFDFDTFVKEGPKFWKEYVRSDEYKSLSQLTHGKPGAVTESPLLSVYIPKDKEKSDEFVDLLGLEAAPGMDLDQFEVHTVPAATYAEFYCTYKTSMKTNRAIYGEWFVSTGYERDGNKPDIAAYYPVPFRPFGEMGIRWWIPVVKK